MPTRVILYVHVRANVYYARVCLGHTGGTCALINCVSNTQCKLRFTSRERQKRGHLIGIRFLRGGFFHPPEFRTDGYGTLVEIQFLRKQLKNKNPTRKRTGDVFLWRNPSKPQQYNVMIALFSRTFIDVFIVILFFFLCVVTPHSCLLQYLHNTK